MGGYIYIDVHDIESPPLARLANRWPRVVLLLLIGGYIYIDVHDIESPPLGRLSRTHTYICIYCIIQANEAERDRHLERRVDERLRPLRQSHQRRRADTRGPCLRRW